MISSVENALVVDDDVLMRDFVVETLTRNKISVTQAGNGNDAMRMLQENDFDIAFIDIKMPGLSGLDLLRKMKEDGIETIAVIITAFGTVEQAVDAMKMGAADFLMKPFSPEQVELIIKKARDLVELQAQNKYLKEELGWTLPRGRQLVGRSERIRGLMSSIEQVAVSSSTVLISGESGTGKELVALAIHSLSERRNRPFVRMNCAAVPDTLMDSELFGHEKGAFTGATSRRVGRFELANGGTLLLDEISEMKTELQSKLLRVLQEREFERVGGTRTIRSDCRVIATTNRDMQELIDNGQFRKDLFFRLNVLPIEAPPLRERASDIPLLVDSFLRKYSVNGKGNSSKAQFSSEAMEALKKYDWAGNVRELENLVERLCVMNSGKDITLAMLPPEIRNGHSVPCEQKNEFVAASDEADSGNTISPNCETTEAEICKSDEAQAERSLNLSDIERKAIMESLQRMNGRKQKAADELGISVRTLRNKIAKYRGEGFEI